MNSSDIPVRLKTIVYQELWLTKFPFLLSVTSVLEDFDYCFAENGLTAYRKGVQLPSEVGCGFQDDFVIVSDPRRECLDDGPAELYQLDGRREISNLGQLLPPLHC
jgi:hypothetical protein